MCIETYTSRFLSFFVVPLCTAQNSSTYGKGIGHPRIGHNDPEGGGGRGIAVFFL